MLNKSFSVCYFNIYIMFGVDPITFSLIISEAWTEVFFIDLIAFFFFKILKRFMNRHPDFLLEVLFQALVIFLNYFPIHVFRYNFKLDYRNIFFFQESS